MKTVKVMISPFYTGGSWTEKKSNVSFNPKRDHGKVITITTEDVSGIEALVEINRLLPVEGFAYNIPAPKPPVNPEFIGTHAGRDFLCLSFDRPVYPVAGRTVKLVIDGVERTLKADSGELKGNVVGFRELLGKTYALSVDEGVFIDKNSYMVSSFQVTEKGITDKPVVVDPTGVVVNPTSINPTEGQTGTISATVNPIEATDKTVTWTSSAPTIITVDNTGKWTAVKAGTATLTAKTVNNKTATVSATVKAPVIAVTGVTASPKTVSGEVGAKAKITATVAPANATNKAFTWTSDKPAIATITNTGDYTLVAEGTAVFTVKTTDGNKVDTVAVTVTAAPEVKVASAPKKRAAAKKKVEESAE